MVRPCTQGQGPLTDLQDGIDARVEVDVVRNLFLS